MNEVINNPQPNTIQPVSNDDLRQRFEQQVRETESFLSDFDTVINSDNDRRFGELQGI